MAADAPDDVSTYADSVWELARKLYTERASYYPDGPRFIRWEHLYEPDRNRWLRLANLAHDHYLQPRTLVGVIQRSTVAEINAALKHRGWKLAFDTAAEDDDGPAEQTLNERIADINAERRTGVWAQSGIDRLFEIVGKASAEDLNAALKKRGWKVAFDLSSEPDVRSVGLFDLVQKASAAELDRALRPRGARVTFDVGGHSSMRQRLFALLKDGSIEDIDDALKQRNARMVFDVDAEETVSQARKEGYDSGFQDGRQSCLGLVTIPGDGSEVIVDGVRHRVRLDPIE